MKHYFVDPNSRRILGEIFASEPANPDGHLIWQAPASGLPAPWGYCTVSADGLTVTADADWQAKERKKLVPEKVTEYQAKSALMQTMHISGKTCYTVVEEYMATPTADPMIVLAWKTCRDYERLDNKIQFIAQNVLQFPLETIDTQLDNLFILAKTIH